MPSNNRTHQNPRDTTITTQANLDSAFEALTRAERRDLLVALEGESFDGLSLEPQAIPERRWIELNHVHLPKLEDAGFVSWDAESQVVTKGPRFTELYPLIEFIHAKEHANPD